MGLGRTEAVEAALERVAPVRRAVGAAWSHRLAGPVLRLVLTALAVPVSMNVVLPETRPLGILIEGAVLGSLYGLSAMGLILIYRANNVINLAQAGMGAVPAVIAVLLIVDRDWPYFVVLPLFVAGALLLGLIVEVVIIRRFAKAPRLILSVVTIGVGQLLAYFEFHTPRWMTGSVLPPNEFPTPFSGYRPRIGGMLFKGDHVFAVVVVIAIAVGLGLFFRYTRIGIAVRASAENADRAALLGIPVRRLSTVVWMLAALMSAFGIFLRAPLVGLPLGTINSPSILLYALAAAVIARFEKLPTALVAGMAMGSIYLGVFYTTRDTNLADAWMLPIILVALLVQRGALSRALDTGVSTWRSVREFRPIPTELRNVREVVVARWVMIGLVSALALGLPFIVGSLYRNDAALLLIYAMLGVSLVVLTGWAGQISLGQFAFAGIGAAVAGGLAVNHGADFFVSVIAAGVVGAAVSFLVGLPALRLQGLMLAVTTLAFAAATSSYFLSRNYFDWLMPERGRQVFRPRLYGRIDVSGGLAFYYLCLVFLVLVVLAARSLRNSRSGRVLVSTRDNAKAAQAYGVNLARTKLAAFALSGFIAAIAGALFAYQQGAVDTGAFRPTESLTIFAVTVVGGLTSVSGGVAGAAYLIAFRRFPVISEIELIELLATGIGMTLLLLFLPGGLSELGVRVRDGYLRWVAARRGIHVPSLVADDREEDLHREQHDDRLLVSVGEEVEHGRSLLATDGGAAVACPACGELVPVADVLAHEHFKPEAATRRARRSRTRVQAVAAEREAEARDLEPLP